MQFADLPEIELPVFNGCALVAEKTAVRCGPDSQFGSVDRMRRLSKRCYSSPF
jgi:hypothetical protein